MNEFQENNQPEITDDDIKRIYIDATMKYTGVNFVVGILLCSLPVAFFSPILLIWINIGTYFLGVFSYVGLIMIVVLYAKLVKSFANWILSIDFDKIKMAILNN